jgi:bifunctional enzyme CysN/CysC
VSCAAVDGRGDVVPVRARGLSGAAHDGLQPGGWRSCVLWLTGLPGAGKSTIARALELELAQRGQRCCVLDGDVLRRGLNRDLGFGAADRAENVRRVAEVARLMVDSGLIVLVALISPFRADRELARGLIGERDFLEIFVDAPLEVVQARDPKGHYARARRGEISNFTGIDSPYEPPAQPWLRIDTTATTPEESAELILAALRGASASRPALGGPRGGR